MSTRATVRFATREEGVSFSEHPKKWHAQFYVHCDGYPEGLGADITDSMLSNTKLVGWELEHIDVIHADIEYVYYIWQDHGKPMWVSIFEVNGWPCDGSCIYVGTPEMLQKSILRGFHVPQTKHEH
jgi:hypothetical protein